MEIPTTKTIKKQVDFEFGFDIAKKTRKREYVDARSIYFKLSREYARPNSFQIISKELKRDHATAMHAIRSIDNIFKYNQDPQLFEKYKLIEQKIMPNNFKKYLFKEDNLQHAVMNYFKIQYPESFVIHVPNEGKRTPFERFKFKYLGGISGVPDVLCFDPKGDFNGLAIELKIKPNRPTENQNKCLKRLKNKSWRVEVVYDFDSCKEIIDDYFSGV